MAATASADQIAKFTLRAGDTIVTKDSETADDIAVAASVFAEHGSNVRCDDIDHSGPGRRQGGSAS